jgi:hypothetical protein
MSLAIDRNHYASNGFPLTERFGATKNEWFDRYLEVDGRIYGIRGSGNQIIPLTVARKMQSTTTNTEAFRLPRLRSQQRIPANALMKRASKNWPSVSRCKGFWLPSGARTGGKQVRGRGRGTSPESGETGGTRKTSRPRSQAKRCRGHRSPLRRVTCSWQEFSLLIRGAARRLHVNDVPSSQFAVAPIAIGDRTQLRACKASADAVLSHQCSGQSRGERRRGMLRPVELAQIQNRLFL